MKKKVDICIINRTFWPESKTIGEGHLCLGEIFADAGHSVAIIFEQSKNFDAEINRNLRGKNIQFKGAKKRGTSSSSIFLRGLFAIFFSFSVIARLIELRPKFIYISTDPPVFVPFAVFIMSKIIGSKYIYHVQDIHPEK